MARVDATQSSIEDARRGGAEIKLTLSQGLPWRVFTLDSPRRLVIDFREVDWTGVDAQSLDQARNVSAVKYVYGEVVSTSIMAWMDLPFADTIARTSTRA